MKPLSLISRIALTFSGASTLVITRGPGVTTGTYALLTASSITGPLPTLSLPAGWTATLQQSGATLNLVVTSAP